MFTTRNRAVSANQLVLDQVDLFQVDVFTRVAGLTFADVTLQVFCQNAVQAWPLADGTGVTDAQIASGAVYFHEVPGAAGTYSLRFRPNVTGYWRLVVSYAPGSQRVALAYDVAPEASTAPGVKPSFLRP